jgi:hypothetical protein
MRAHVEREDIVTQSVAGCQPCEPSSLALFRQRLPRKPYHTNGLEYGLLIRSAARAANARYIQPNGPTHRYWLVYDVDRSGAALDWSDRNAPPPTIVATNPDNGHAHLIYGLEVPVRTAPGAKSGPLRYAAAVDCALRALLDADESYSGLICKNPLHSHWRVMEWESSLYDLGDLDSWLDLSAYSDRRKRLPEYGLGRNCNLFERLRHWAYRAIRQGWPDYERWLTAVQQRAHGYNTAPEPLPHREVEHTAKSVAKWTHQNMSPAGFTAVQAQRGRRKGEKTRALMMPWVKKKIAQGLSQREIAKELGVDHKTIANWIKREGPQ